MENYLFENYLIDSIKIAKPKKYDEYYISKIKYSLPESKDLVNFNLQLPLMVIKDITTKEISLEFTKNNNYSNGCYDFLCKIEDYILKSIQGKCKDWFNKEIPVDVIKNMYNNFLKAPQTNTSNVFINVMVSKNSKFYNSRNKELGIEDLKSGINTECICQLKYLMFSKDTSYVVWELITSKSYKKVNKVKQYGFIEDPEDYFDIDQQEDELEEINNNIKNNTFF
jgi:hypothetical protein